MKNIDQCPRGCARIHNSASGHSGWAPGWHKNSAFLPLNCSLTLWLRCQIEGLSRNVSDLSHFGPACQTQRSRVHKSSLRPWSLQDTRKLCTPCGRERWFPYSPNLAVAVHSMILLLAQLTLAQTTLRGPCHQWSGICYYSRWHPVQGGKWNAGSSMSAGLETVFPYDFPISALAWRVLPCFVTVCALWLYVWCRLCTSNAAMLVVCEVGWKSSPPKPDEHTKENNLKLLFFW